MDICNNHSLLPSPRWHDDCRFEIFLSFRGGDVRKDFIEFLYRGLANSGIHTFFDRDGIEVGEVIMPRILKVIGQTKICIPVFSKDFASSKSCLKEVAEMVRCKRMIMPIFYDVSTDVVGKQQGSYQKSFCTHAALGVESTTIDEWKKALHSVSRRRGWRFEKFNHVECDLIREVVSTVRRLLEKDDLDVTENLVGMGHHMREMMKRLGIRYENDQVVEGQTLEGKRVIRISGVLGIGKSTLAKIVYNKIHHLFDESSFLKVEGESLPSLKENLITQLRKRNTPFRPAADATFIKGKLKDARVLLVLDDVSDSQQILSLGIDLSEFSLGSRIIVISNSNVVDEYILALETSQRSGDQPEGIPVEKYELGEMNKEHAFHLFCKCALRGQSLKEELSDLAWDISSAAEGLPLLIDAVGSSLFGKCKKSWEDAYDIMTRKPFNEKIRAIMETRYEALDLDAREIFLDIACFFTEKDKRIPSYMWEACGYNPHTRLAQIHSMSLVKTTGNHELWMHNQVKFFGMEIVKKENPSKPSKRRRLWIKKDVEGALREVKVTAVEGLSARFDEPPSFDEDRFFHNFRNLSYLRISQNIFRQNEQSAWNSTEDVFLPELKWLEWQWCHDISSLVAFQRSDLLVLDLSWSASSSWRDWKQIMEKARKLKVLILKHCSGIVESPVPDAPINLELERLDLEGCSLLPGVGISFINLGKLVSLNVKSCSFVQKLPEDIGSLVALEELYIDGTSIGALDFPEGSCGNLKILSACNCKNLKSLSNIGNLKSLSYLALDDTELSELPDGIVLLENLQKLYLRNCKILVELPEPIGRLEKLQVMDLSYSMLNELPPSVNNLQNLKVLKMRGTFITAFPEGIRNLGRLEEIDFSFCRNLTGECDIRGLSSLRVLLLEKTKFSEVIGTNGQSFDFPNLIRDGKFRISENRR